MKRKRTKKPGPLSGTGFGLKAGVLPDLLSLGEAGLDPGDLHFLDVPDGVVGQDLDGVFIIHSVLETDAGGGGTDGLDDGQLGGLGTGLGRFHVNAFELVGGGNMERVADGEGVCQTFLRSFFRLGWNQAAMEEACQG